MAASASSSSTFARGGSAFAQKVASSSSSKTRGGGGGGAKQHRLCSSHNNRSSCSRGGKLGAPALGAVASSSFSTSTRTTFWKNEEEEKEGTSCSSFFKNNGSKYRGRGALQTLCAKKGKKGNRTLPMDTEYMFDPRIPRLKKGHKVRTTEDFEENHKAYYDQEPGELHELMSYERPQMIFPELPPKLTGGARVIPPRIFSKWLDPYITDYWTCLLYTSPSP